MLALIAFAVGLVIRLVDTHNDFSDVWFWLFLGLILMLLEGMPIISSRVPWRRT